MRTDHLKVNISKIIHPLKTYRRMQYYYRVSGQFEEIFVRGAYQWLTDRLIGGTTVIDLGANIGDTAIYFAMHPYVNKIFAYEPNSSTYAIATSLIEQNPYRNKISLINKAVRGSDGPPSEHEISLNEILAGQESRAIVIKSDVEGAEHQIFDSKVDHLAGVYAMMIEYHGGPKELPKILGSRGFAVKADAPWISDKYLGDVGYVFAWRGTEAESGQAGR